MFGEMRVSARARLSAFDARLAALKHRAEIVSGRFDTTPKVQAQRERLIHSTGLLPKFAPDAPGALAAPVN
jgi:hypothetical protein